ncbi:hypothetical protein NT017_19810 [Prolixibacter sp. NT017]|nr:hypothetical protein NT017_19810 [Prolixibacter sp. NT017]
MPWHFPLHEDTSIKGASNKAEDAFRVEYSAIYRYLLQFKEGLSKRNKAETGIRYEWYALQRWGANYWEDFFRPKIVWAETMRIHRKTQSRFPRFCFDNSCDYITDKTCFFATGDDLKIILSILNSKLGKYLCSKYVSILDSGGT